MDSVSRGELPDTPLVLAGFFYIIKKGALEWE